MIFRISVAVVLAFVLSMSEIAGQCFKGCSREMVEEGAVPAKALKNLIQRSETIFIGTVTSVEPAVPVYPKGENADWEAYSKASDEFRRINVVTFAVESVWKGEKVDTLKLRGDDLLQIYRNTKRFLIFVGKENKDGFRIDLNKNVFGFADINHPDFHWDVDLGKSGLSPSGELLPTKAFRSDKRLPDDYGPYVRKWNRTEHLWMRGDTAYWTPALKRAVAAKLVELDPRFQDPTRREEVFSLTTRGCQITDDEMDRRGGVGFWGWTPCPMPVVLIQAYAMVLAER